MNIKILKGMLSYFLSTLPKVNKKRAALLRLLYFRRCLADSNRRRRFCRP